MTAARPRSSTLSPMACPSRVPESSPREHRGETGEVEHVGEEPGVPRHAAQPRRTLVVHFTPEPTVPEHGIVLGGRDPVARRRGRQEPRRGHAERSEHPPDEKAVERLTRHALYGLHEHDGAQVGVAVARSRRRDKRRRVHGGERRGAGRGGVVQREVRHEARRVGQELAHRHAILQGSAPERGHVAGDRCIELELPRVHQQHAGGREAHHLRERGDVVQRAGVHRAGIIDAVVADRREQREPAVSSHGDHGARERTAVHFGPEIRDHAREARAVEAQGERRGPRDAGARRDRRILPGPRPATRGDECDEHERDAAPHGRAAGTVTPQPRG